MTQEVGGNCGLIYGQASTCPVTKFDRTNHRKIPGNGGLARRGYRISNASFSG